MPPDILFDLDGTLIDSSPGILASFGRILAAAGLPPAVPLAASLIGPPLAVTLQQVSGIADEVRLTRLVEAFKQDYDTAGYLATEMFPVATAWRNLRRRCASTSTNKYGADAPDP